ncbi:sulfite oxidase [Penicillium macrosclerotiorum]|uniref:sulfite oxidase n=1 Tax=Penicillium macrosclerotiorum TaxID=303699 RepID=UPI0025487506|nr:sulfite oxidase [Penicillium macrosclerotiorum]KAJ5669844.1 sulfite oxidase [Penicillium macrosclerotiorum]
MHWYFHDMIKPFPKKFAVSTYSNLKVNFRFITPQDLSYDRNHGPIPHICADKHFVRVDGLVKTPLSFSADQLRSDFAQHEVTCALECAGNRRHTMRTRLSEVEGIDWGDGAVMNCKWEGPRIRDVLLRTGLGDDVIQKSHEIHVAFACYQVRCQEDHWFGSSVTLERCLREDCDAIIALKVNDGPLTANHGYPLRVVLPGITGARWVKWLDRITIQAKESPNFYQQYDYKILPPEAVNEESAEKHRSRTSPMYDTPINSVIAIPAEGEYVYLPSTGTVKVKGYAVPQGADGPITCVEVSGDQGRSWVNAKLNASTYTSRWCWALWTADVRLAPGQKREIISRASDAGGNMQRSHSTWNLRGMGYNGYGRTTNLTVM